MEEVIKHIKRDDSLDYLNVLKSIRDLPFLVGKNLLIDFLSGDLKNKSIKNNELEFLDSFSCLSRYPVKDIEAMIDNLIENNLIEIVSGNKNRFLKLLNLTQNGREEIRNPRLYKNKLKGNFIERKTEITEEDKIKFNELASFLERYNDLQKKAIITDSKKILCIAGAGSGKTSVLTKRIEFLVKYKGLNPGKILAITFTRKARQEMAQRLAKLGVSVHVETFNSFCEKILNKYGNIIYGRPISVISYGNKVMGISSALSNIGLTMDKAIDSYFSEQQKRNKTKEQMYNIFMNDCFMILDYFKTKNKELYDFSKEAELKDKNNAIMLFKICSYLKNYMNLSGLRDYTDQIIDATKFFRDNKESIPEFSYILVDEFQDVNSMQIELLDLLNPENLFVVGDPRQSIFGWRGSNIKYILDFENKYLNSEVITLTKNYRSSKHLVEFMNLTIKDMKLPDLENHKEGEKDIKLLNFDSEEKEFNFVANEILSLNIEKDQIFVLARTNRQIAELTKLMNQKQIPIIVKTDEINNPTYDKKDHVTLATIHAIKGLEAKVVFIVGVNEMNFPCKASDHPVIEMIKMEEYDKEEEEKRLFYVAISRAKQRLYLTYSGKRVSYFVNDEMMNLIGSTLKGNSFSGRERQIQVWKEKKGEFRDFKKEKEEESLILGKELDEDLKEKDNEDMDEFVGEIKE
jgi:superfamily I DNA/RNA helicase